MMRPDKVTSIVYVANSTAFGGANRVLTDLIAGLDRSRFKPSIIAPTDGPLVDWAKARSITCRIIPAGDHLGRVALVRRAAQMAPAVIGAGAHIVHAIDPMCYRAAGLASAVAGASSVCHIEFPIDRDHAAWSFRFGPDVIVTCYERQARETEEHLDGRKPDCKVVAVHNAVDTNAFSAGTGRRLVDAKHIALIIGHLSEIKGYPTFLRAAAKTAAALDDCEFLLLGGETIQKGFGAYLKELADELGIAPRVHFLGWRQDVPDVIRSSDVVVLPSQAEGLPLSILEAMACAKPVIASPVNGVPEAVEDGVTGLLVQPGSPDALSGAMLRLFRDPAGARAMGEKGRRVAEERFSISAFVSRMERIYEDLRRQEDYRRCSSIIL